MPAVNGLRLEQEIVERQPVERPRRLARPRRSVRKRCRHSLFIPHFEHPSILPILIAVRPSSHARKANASGARRAGKKLIASAKRH
jgi:hypothetical protein